MWIITVAAFGAALASDSAPAEATKPNTAEYQLVQTPGPRGTVRWVKIKAPPASVRCYGRVRYKLVQLPGPRSGTRLVKRCASEQPKRGPASTPDY